MDPLRKFYLLLVILGVIFVSVVIGIIFILINKWISRRAGKHAVALLQKRHDFKVESNKYQERNLDACPTPALPPRTQFITAEAQSYENLAEVPDYEDIPDTVQDIPDYEQDVHDYEQDVHDYEQDVHDYEQDAPDYVKVEGDDYEESTEQQPDYLTLEDEVQTFPPPPPPTGGALGESYENLAEEPEYEQSTDDQPDYVQVEGDEEVTLPHPSHPAADSISTEDYDDIGTENEEDYDDVG